MPVQLLNRATRDDIFRRTLAAVRAEVAPDSDPADLVPLVAQCLEFAWCGYQILKTWPGAPRTVIQAGTAQWPRIPAELDDGVCSTHFSYVWEPDSEIAVLMRCGFTPLVRRADGRVACSLPEMHVWLGCPDTGELIDFTAGLWPLACRLTLGEEWLAPDPPPYLWTFATRRPVGVNYFASPNAIDCVVSVLREQGKAYP